MDPLRQAMQADMITAMKNEDRATLAVLRSALAVIAAAEQQAEGDLTPQQAKLALLDEIEQRRHTVGYYESAGRQDEARGLQSEVDVLERYLYLT